MKEGWTYRKLGEVCDFEGGSQPPKSEWINNPKDGYVRMLQIRDFTKSREAEVEYVKLTKKLRLCKSDDILIGRYGASVGKILTGLEGAYNVAIIKTIPDETQITKGFIRRYFESSTFQQLLQKVCVVRTAQAGFSKDDINETLIPIPSIDEQQRIVSRLDSAFAHIDEMKANAEKQLSEARALFQKALSKAMEPKEGWVEKKVNSICDVINGFAFPSSAFSGEGEIKTVKITNVGIGQFIEDNQNNVSKDYLHSVKEAIVMESDIVIALTRTIINGGFKVAIVPSSYNGSLLNQRVAALRAIPHKISKEFLYYYYQTKSAEQYVLKRVNTLMQPNLSIKDLKAMHIPLPPLSEQQRIVSRLDSLSAHVRELEEVLQKTIAECDALKQALLRKVFE